LCSSHSTSVSLAIEGLEKGSWVKAQCYSLRQTIVRLTEVSSSGLWLGTVALALANV